MSQPIADAPECSVVIASPFGEAALARCLESLMDQARAAGAEVIAPTTVAPEALDQLAARFPTVQFIPAAAKATVFQLRTLGIERAVGSQIMLTEDHCVLSPGWLGAMQGGLRAGHVAVGGPVDRVPGCGIPDWALYFCEYGSFMPPLAGGPAPILSGINAAYSRAALESCRAVWRDGFHENEVHDALRAAGHGLHRVEEAQVGSTLSMTLGAGIEHLFWGGRRFGGYRRSHSSVAARAFWVAAAPAVPLVLLGRIVRSVAARRPDRVGVLLRGLPRMACLLMAWSAGEALSYLGVTPPARSHLPRPERA